MGCSTDERLVISEIKRAADKDDWVSVASLVDQHLAAGHKLNRFLVGVAIKAQSCLENHQRAEFFVDEGLKLEPRDASLLSSKGRFFAKRGNWARSLAYYEQARSIRTDVPQFHFGAGLAAFKLRRYGEAVDRLKLAVEGTGNNAAWWRYLGRALFIQGALKEAHAAYDSALRLHNEPGVRCAAEEIRRQLKSGKRRTQLSSQYYDAVYQISTQYQADWKESQYADLWRTIGSILERNGVRHILDLGCGPGQFAQFISDRLPNVQYTGVDFSEIAVAHARRRVPAFRFVKHELPIGSYRLYEPLDAIVCMEMLEHVECDIEILRGIPEGVLFLGSVPSFDSFGHVRHFVTEAEIQMRYGTSIGSMKIQGISCASRNIIWLLMGRGICSI